MAWSNAPRRRGTRVSGIVGVLVVVWLIIGAIAAGQRHYYNDRAKTCAHVSTLLVTIVAGPLNYVGANPKVHCHVPQPSK